MGWNWKAPWGGGDVTVPPQLCVWRKGVRVEYLHYSKPGVEYIKPGVEYTKPGVV